MAKSAKAIENTELKVGVGVVPISGKDAIILDPLNVKALVFTQATERIAIVECDLGGVPTDTAAQARTQASQKTGIPYANICVAATHTHMARCRKENLVPSIVAAIEKANRNCKPATIETSLSSTCTVSFNRRYWMKDGTVMFNPMFLNPDIVRPAGPIDPEVVFALFRNPKTGKAIASLSNFALHCDTVKEYGAVFQNEGAGSRNTVSADYPYWLEKNLKKEFGRGLTSIFATGCCGNINHWDFSKPGPQSGHKTTAKHIGDELFQGIKKKKRGEETPALASRYRSMRIPLRLPSARESWPPDTEA